MVWRPAKPLTSKLLVAIAFEIERETECKTLTED